MKNVIHLNKEARKADSGWKSSIQVLRELKGVVPSPAQIKAAREAKALTQADAAAMVYCTLNAWQKWEAGGQ